MKYRYPFKALWLPALLLALCLSMTLISAAVWLIVAASNEDSTTYTASLESVIPAVLMLAAWIGCGVLAGRLRLKTLLWFGIGFWGIELLLYLLCMIPAVYDAAQIPLAMLTLPMWSYFALIELIDAQNTAANLILTVLPAVALIGVYVWLLVRPVRRK